jgi:X-Pro dipeptidyl-peptidase
VFGYDDAIRERVFLDSSYDSDGDGQPDRIAMDVMRPKNTEDLLKVPTILISSPYFSTSGLGPDQALKADTDSDGLLDSWPLFYDNYFVPRGYAVALLDTPGTSNSTGCPLVGGKEDVEADDLAVRRLATAPWSNGRVGMVGHSYNGTEANAAAASGVDGLQTVVPISGISSWYDYFNVNGLPFTGTASALAQAVTDPAERDHCAASRTAMAAAAGSDGTTNPFWAERDYRARAGDVKASVFVVHDLNDTNVKPNHYGDWWSALAAHDVPRKLWLSQPGHADPFDYDRAAWVDTIHGWFDYWLQHVDNGIMDEPMARIERQADQTGHTVSHDEYAAWPDPSASATSLWLRAGALATTPAAEPAGATWQDQKTQAESTAVRDPDSTANTHRLAFLSPVLDRDVRISGGSSLDVRLGADATDPPLGAMLVDYGATPFETVSPTLTQQSPAEPDCVGDSSAADSACYRPSVRSYLSAAQFVVSRGAMDLSNRTSLAAKTPLEPGTSYDVHLPLWTQDYTFLAGHRIGLVVVGSYSGYGTRTQFRSTNYTVALQASRLTLPVVGGTAALGF